MNSSPPEFDTAIALWQSGQAEQALALLERHARHPEGAARARALQAAFLHQQHRYGEALAMALQAIKLDPTLREAWESAGHALISRKKWAEARQLLALAFEAFPQSGSLGSWYALALVKTGEIELAYERINRTLQHQPDLAVALLARIEILCEAGCYDLALRECARLPVNEMPETTRFTQGSLKFLTGDWAEGFRLLSSVIKSGWRGKPLPEWDGKPALDQHVVIYNAQAFGDLIQFVRYIDRARAKLGNVTLQVPRSMERLIRASFPDLPLITENENAPLPDDVSLRYSLASLANASDGRFDLCADKVPYLKAPQELVEVWREKLAAIPRPRIGIVWSSPWQMNNPFRVVDFAALKPLLDAAGKHLVSLQMGEAAQDAAAAGVFDASPLIGDFADSAALMNELDLVISLDSAPAHLAGALGKPVWVFLPFNGEWRWLVEREDCIWYPTMRLFRQNRPQGWSDVMEDLAADVTRLLNGDRNVLQCKSWLGTAPCRHPKALPLT